MTARLIPEAQRGLFERAAAQVREVLESLSLRDQDVFLDRLATQWPRVLRPLQKLFGDRADFDEWIVRWVGAAARGHAERSWELRRLDLRRLAEPDWFQRPDRLGYVCYVDRFAGDLKEIETKIPYLEELGVTYLHLMPLLRTRAGENDGGYAVADYGSVEPRLGTIDDLERLAASLRSRGISLCVDLVCNHTAREHAWSQRALEGDPEYLDYYWTFPDRTLPDRYESTLLEVFPTFAPGNFTWEPKLDRWVWTTFHEFQWDLNYTNPAVLAEMLAIILKLANRGVEVLRLDAVAFLGKRLGTNCQNQPEAHLLLQAMRALSRIAAPALLHKAEAIVPPPELVPYLGQGEAAGVECEFAYHNVLMVTLWSALAERKVALLTHTLQRMPAIPVGTSWITYVRCHDDIGWAVTEEDAAAVGLDGASHRRFLSDFYGDQGRNTFSRGDVFQENPRTGDRRISGTLASLAGLEAATEAGDPGAVEAAIRRVHLLHGVIFAMGGLPVIYMGDEIGLTNDYGFSEIPEHSDDNRWLHRPAMSWSSAERRHDESTVEGRIFQGLLRSAKARRQTPMLHVEEAARAVWTHDESVFGLLRDGPRGRLLVLANFSDQGRAVPGYRLRELGFDCSCRDRLTGTRVEPGRELPLDAYELLWLEPMT